MLSDADAGVNVIRPATSRNARPGLELPAVDAATFSVIEIAAVPPAGTVTDDALSRTLCGDEIVWFAGATLNVAADAPWFVSVISRDAEKFVSNSAKP